MSDEYRDRVQIIIDQILEHGIDKVEIYDISDKRKVKTEKAEYSIYGFKGDQSRILVAMNFNSELIKGADDDYIAFCVFLNARKRKKMRFHCTLGNGKKLTATIGRFQITDKADLIPLTISASSLIELSEE